MRFFYARFFEGGCIYVMACIRTDAAAFTPFRQPVPVADVYVY
jgi:hypothetical protein